jgi:hypothetical protein
VLWCLETYVSEEESSVENLPSGNSYSVYLCTCINTCTCKESAIHYMSGRHTHSPVVVRG